MQNYLAALLDSFETHANSQEAIGMKKYMRNQFPFLGIKKPIREEILKHFLKEKGLPSADSTPTLIRNLWQMPEREYQYLAMTLLEKSKKQRQETDLELLEELIITKSWWDTVDFIAANLIGDYFKRFPDKMIPISQKWIVSENMWLQRTAILFQLSYKKTTNESLLYEYIGQCAESKEFFIQKAIGWALRQYARTAPQSVRQFVESYPLKPLSRREALKHL